MSVGGRHLVILGQMGVGKSSTGRAAAAALGWEYADSDEDLTTLLGQDGRSIAAERGLEALHDLEAAVLLGALARGRQTVITAAASTVERPLARDVMRRRSTIVRLDAPLALTQQRQAAGGHRRPMTIDELEALSARREPLFREVEDIVLSAERPIEELVEAIVALVMGA